MKIRIIYKNQYKNQNVNKNKQNKHLWKKKNGQFV